MSRQATQLCSFFLALKKSLWPYQTLNIRSDLPEAIVELMPTGVERANSRAGITNSSGLKTGELGTARLGKRKYPLDVIIVLLQLVIDHCDDVSMGSPCGLSAWHPLKNSLDP